ncbi:MAG: hypothetical protein V3W18_14095 [candidate division Zixibacteria bacterium]
MSRYVFILAVSFALFYCRAYGYQTSDEIAKSDSLYSEPESSAVSMDERFVPGSLNLIESPEVKFRVVPNYPNPF